MSTSEVKNLPSIALLELHNRALMDWATQRHNMATAASEYAAEALAETARYTAEDVRQYREEMMRRMDR